MIEKTSETIARAVILRGRRILLVHRKGASNTFLPGGHVEHGETAAESLARELREELGAIEFEIGTFLGIVEHRYTNSGGEVTETNLVFRVKAPALDPASAPLSCEDHLEFHWAACTADALETERLEPWILREHLPALTRDADMPPFLSAVATRGVDG